MSADPRFLVERTHHGVVLAFPRWPPDASIAGLSGLAWIGAVSISLFVVGYPTAALVESMGWWLVDEALLASRWQSIGLAAWPLVFAAGWLWTRGTLELPVEVDRHGVGWAGRSGWHRIAWADVTAVERRDHTLVFELDDGARRWLPGLRAESLDVLESLVEERWSMAVGGTSDEVPDAIGDITRRTVRRAVRRRAVEL